MLRLVTIMVLTVISSTLYAQTNSEALEFSNLYPEATQRLGFTFKKTRSSLIDEKNIYIEVYEFNEGNKIVKEPKLLKKENFYSGSFIIDSNTHVIAFYIFSDNEVDNNFGEGYFLPIYKNKKLIKPYYKTRAELYSFYGEYNFNLARSHQKSLEFLEKGLKAFPDFYDNPDYYESYINAIGKTDQINGTNIRSFKIAEIEMRPTISEGFYDILESFYTEVNNKKKSDSLLLVEKQKFPNGGWTVRNLYFDLLKEKNPEKKATDNERHLPNNSNHASPAFQYNHGVFLILSFFHVPLYSFHIIYPAGRHL